MLDTTEISEEILQQNCKVKRTYRNCKKGVLCDPTAVFDMIEKCKICNKTI